MLFYEYNYNHSFPKRREVGMEELLCRGNPSLYKFSCSICQSSISVFPFCVPPNVAVLGPSDMKKINKFHHVTRYLSISNAVFWTVKVCA